VTWGLRRVVLAMLARDLYDARVSIYALG